MNDKKGFASNNYNDDKGYTKKEAQAKGGRTSHRKSDDNNSES